MCGYGKDRDWSVASLERRVGVFQEDRTTSQTPAVAAPQNSSGFRFTVLLSFPLSFGPAECSFGHISKLVNISVGQNWYKSFSSLD